MINFHIGSKKLVREKEQRERDQTGAGASSSSSSRDPPDPLLWDADSTTIAADQIVEQATYYPFREHSDR